MDLRLEHKSFTGVLFSAQHLKVSHSVYREKRTVTEEIHFQMAESKLKGSRVE